MTNSPEKELKAYNGAYPYWIETKNGQIFSWYHPANPNVSPKGAVVLCNTFGSESMRLYPAYRAIAINLAQAGFACMRFDYPGTGDSSGTARDEGLLPQWLDSIGCVIETIKTHTQLTTVSIFGAMLGGTLALKACERRQDVDAVFLWGPYLSGKSFLRSAKLQNSVIIANKNKIKPSDWQEGDEEAFGFLISKSFSNDLLTLDIKTLNNFCPEKIVICPRGETAEESQLQAQLGKLIEVSRIYTIGADDLTKTIEDIGSAPVLTKNIIVSLLNKKSNEKGNVSDIKNSSKQCVTIDNQCSEQWETLGSLAPAFCIISSPLPKVKNNNIGIVLINGGRNHRVGINRNYTEWARDWAKQGYTVLRLDISGLGDTPARTGDPENTLYLQSSIDDVNSSIEHLKQRLGIKKVVLAGLCAGAYLSYQCALLQPSLSAIILINPLRFQKPVKVSEGRVTRHSVLQLAKSIGFFQYAYFFLQPSNWTILYRLCQTREGLLWVASMCKSALTNLLKAIFWPIYISYKKSKNELIEKNSNELAHGIHQIIKSGTKIQILFNCNETILPIFYAAISLNKKAFFKSGFFDIQEIKNTDHVLSPLWSQEKVFETITEFLEMNLRNID